MSAATSRTAAIVTPPVASRSVRAGDRDHARGPRHTRGGQRELATPLAQRVAIEPEQPRGAQLVATGERQRVREERTLEQRQRLPMHARALVRAQVLDDAGDGVGHRSCEHCESRSMSVAAAVPIACHAASFDAGQRLVSFPGDDDRRRRRCRETIPRRARRMPHRARHASSQRRGLRDSGACRRAAPRMSTSSARAQRLGSRRIASPTTMRYLCVRDDRRARAHRPHRSRRRSARGADRLDDRARVPRRRRAPPRRTADRGTTRRRVHAVRIGRAGAERGIMSDATTSALAIAAAVRAGKTRAHAVAPGALERIARRDATLNAFTSVLGERALADADAIDRRLAAGDDPGSLAGVPLAAKNLFDVAGLATLARSKINAGHPPATRDAAAVARLRAAAAVLVGALNMDEYAYGFSTENTHYGPTRNPRDPSRIAGGSSGGSAAAVAGGLVPLTLGTDTNGSIRVPAALCGVFGLKPTFGRVSRAGVVPPAWSVDHVGPVARHVADLAAAFDAIAGPDPLDPACSTLPPPRCSGELERGIDGLRLAVAGGHFARLAADEALAAVTRVAAALGARREVSLPEAHRARAAAPVITACEGRAYHLENLRARAADVDPMIRDHLLAAALLPAAAYPP